MSVLPGTVVGVKAKEGVIIASEKRLTYDGFVLSRNVKKVFPVTPGIGIGFAGLMGDVNFLVKLLKFEVSYYEVTHGKPISARSLAKLTSAILYSYKLAPLLTEIVIGGYDGEEPSLYILDPAGSVIPERYAALGSGSQLAIGYLEPKYNEGITLDEAEKLAIGAIQAVIERDVLSGDGIDVLRITKKGIEEREMLFKPVSEG